jgi:hypothetical protein
MPVFQLSEEFHGSDDQEGIIGPKFHLAVPMCVIREENVNRTVML